ncbi:MAG: ribokinase [Candidatus Lokiarchaeota archaeon]|nr:ribokinase [Candidatus Lokiarchaeota archaeon]
MSTPLPDPYTLIIGSSNMDLNIYSRRFPKPGETVTGGVFRQFLGGKGANQAVASVRSGSNTIFIGKIGMDTFGNDMVSQLNKEGVNIEYVIRDPLESSGVAFILIDEKGENMISVAPGANFKLSPEEVRDRSEIIRNAKCLVVQMEIPIETIEEIYKIASQGNVVKILNPAPLKPISPSILSKIDIIIPNEGELIQLHSLLKFKNLKGNDNEKIIQASKHISHLGVKTIITTLGKKGCVIYDAITDSITKVPAFEIPAVDTVGAGDCFNGVLASKICQGEELLTSVIYATAAASIAITRQGAQASMPYRSEIEDRFNDYNANHTIEYQ